MKTHNNPLYLYIITTMLLFFNAIMLIFPKEILAAAKNGLLLWYNNVVPSLLPFMIFTAMLIGTGFPQRLGKLAKPLCRAVFNVSGEGSFALVTGLMAGCPLGAKTVCDLYAEGLISKNEAERLVMFCNNTGPLFVVGAVGGGMLQNGRTGLYILAVQYISAFIIGIFTGLFSKRDKKRTAQRRTESKNMCALLSASVMSGVNGITLVGGFIVLFSVICAIPQCLGIMPESTNLRGVLYGILEVTNGSGVLTGTKKASLPLLCGIVSWGGFSIHAQSAAFMTERGLSVKKYLLGKAAQGILAFCISSI